MAEPTVKDAGRAELMTYFRDVTMKASSHWAVAVVVYTAASPATSGSFAMIVTSYSPGSGSGQQTGISSCERSSEVQNRFHFRLAG
jgi:hypothetical protein